MAIRVRNHRAILRVLAVTNLQTGHCLNVREPRMKTLIASTAIAASLAGASFAQGAGDAEAAIQIAADDVVGARLYVAEHGASEASGFSEEWVDVGVITEANFDGTGDLVTIMADFGSFLGQGESELLIDAADLALVPGSGPDELFFVTREVPMMLRAAPEFDNEDMETRTGGVIAVDQEGSGMTTAASPSITTTMSDQVDEASPFEMDQGVDGSVETDIPDLDDGTVVANPRTPATAVIDDGRVETPTPDIEAMVSEEMAAGTGDPEVADGLPMGGGIERMGYSPLLAQDVVLADLVGQGLFGPDDENLGEIGGIIDQEPPLVLLDIGGFLGLGEHEIAVPADALTYLSGAGGIRVHIDATQDELEELPRYEG
jgi:hypothetical protein